MKVLRRYKVDSGQIINIDKSMCYRHEKVTVEVCYKIKRITGVKQGRSPFIYLECPILYGQKNKGHFEDLIRKVAKRVVLWKNKFLTFGGRHVLTEHGLQSMYILSVLNPPTSFITHLHKLLARYFGGNVNGANNKHKVSWDIICYPTKERGLDFRSLHYVSTTLFAKLLWNFRTSTSSLLSGYI